MTISAEEQYQIEYDAAMAQMDAAAGVTPTATTAEVASVVAKSASTEVVAPDIAKTDPEATPDLATLRDELEKTRKALKDTQAWGTKNAQRLAEVDRERSQREREATKPQILDLNPELADAIRYVAEEPVQRQPERQVKSWQNIVQAAHPGIFDTSIDPELENILVARREALGPDWHDPIIAIREIAKEKIAFAERQVGKRFAVESAKLSQKSAMSVPGTGGGSARAPASSADDETQRILKMSDAQFAREVRRVKGY